MSNAAVAHTVYYYGKQYSWGIFSFYLLCCEPTVQLLRQGHLGDELPGDRAALGRGWRLSSAAGGECPLPGSQPSGIPQEQGQLSVGDCGNLEGTEKHPLPGAEGKIHFSLYLCAGKASSPVQHTAEGGGAKAGPIYLRQWHLLLQG